MSKQREDRCYLCYVPVRKYRLKPGEPPPADQRTRDHVPPDGLFLDPKPTDLLTVTCCFRCNNEHSGFDERLRILASMPFDRNRADQTILNERVIGGTLSEQRQMGFFQSLVDSMGAMSDQPGLVRMRVDAKEFQEGITRITKGLLVTLHPRLDYRGSSFEVIDIHPQPFREQLKAMAYLKTGKYLERGNSVFRCWRHVDEENGRGVWMFVFYECFGFIATHTNGPEIEMMREKLRSEFPNYDH